MDGFIRAFQRAQLSLENPPSQAGKHRSPEQEEYGGYIQKTFYFVLSFGLIALSIIGINKSIDRAGYLGGIFLTLCFLPFAAGVCTFLYGFLNLTFP